MNITDFLMTCPIFDGVPRESLERMETKFVVQDYKDGEPLYRMGEKPRYLYIVLEGKVRFDHRIPDGSEFILYLTGETLSCGEVEILNNYDAIASASIVGDTRLVQLKREHFFELLRAEPEFGISLSRVLSRHVHYSIVAANYHYYRDTESRLAKVITQFAERFSEPPTADGDRTISVNLTHEDLSNIVGTTRQTISKLMNQWKNKHWVEYKYGRITVKDYDGLSQHFNELTAR